MSVPRCSRGHVVPRYDLQFCDAGHEHRAHLCSARLGVRVCGEAFVIPEYAEGCREDDDESEDG